MKLLNSVNKYVSGYRFIDIFLVCVRACNGHYKLNACPNLAIRMIQNAGVQNLKKTESISDVTLLYIMTITFVVPDRK